MVNWLGTALHIVEKAWAWSPPGSACEALHSGPFQLVV